MDNEYIKQQIVLFLTGEKTEIDSETIRKIVSSDPELQKEYDEISGLLNASKSPCPLPSEKQWADFMSELHSKIVMNENANGLRKIINILFSPLRIAASISAAAIIIIAVLIFLHRGKENPVIVDRNSDKGAISEVFTIEYEPAYLSIEDIDNSYKIAENLIPHDEEIRAVESIYATFRCYDEKALQDYFDSDEIEFEELKRYYNNNNNNENEGIS